MRGIPAEHETQHFIECLLLLGSIGLIEIGSAMHLTGIGINEVSYEHGLEATHVHFSVMAVRSEEHTSELQSQSNLVCRLLLEKKKKQNTQHCSNTTNVSQLHIYAPRH